MKQFKEGQIVKAVVDTPYVSVGEIAEVRKKKDFQELSLVFYEGTDEESAFPCSQASPEHFDFYEKVA